MPGFYVPHNSGHRTRQNSNITFSCGTVTDIASVELSGDEHAVESGCEFASPPPSTINEEGEEHEWELEEADEDEDSWITPETLGMEQLNVDVDESSDTNTTQLEVACMTFDFAMQNVLLQLNLKIISPAKLLIKETRSYALRCSACFKLVDVFVC